MFALLRAHVRRQDVRLLRARRPGGSVLDTSGYVHDAVYHCEFLNKIPGSIGFSSPERMSSSPDGGDGTGRGNVDDPDREVSRWRPVATLAPRQRHAMLRAPDTGTFRPQGSGTWLLLHGPPHSLASNSRNFGATSASSSGSVSPRRIVCPRGELLKSSSSLSSVL